MASNNTILIKRSAVPGKIPTVDNLDLGELALNTYDGRLFTKREFDTQQQIVEFVARVPVGNALFVTTTGSDTNDGLTWERGVATLDQAIQLAINRGGEHTLIDIAPGTYASQGALNVPDNCMIRAAPNSVTIVPATGRAQNNALRVGSNTVIQGLSFKGWTHDNLVAPTVGFAIGFRPNALITIPPIIDRVNVSRLTMLWDRLAPPLDHEQKNPLVGVGGGLAIANGLVCNRLSLNAIMNVSNSICENENGIGLLASNGAFIRVNSCQILWAHIHMYALDGGRIEAQANTTAYGDFTMVAEGTTPQLESSIVIAPFTPSAAAQNIIFGSLQSIVDQAALTASISTWTPTEQIEFRSVIADLVRATGWTIGSGNSTPFVEFPLILFSLTGQFFNPTREFNYWQAFTTVGNLINALPGLTTTVRNTIALWFASLNNQNNNRVFFNVPALIDAVNHMWRGVMSGVVVTKKIPEQSAASIQDSILELEGGVVTITGQDDQGVAVLATGVIIDTVSGEITGVPFEQSANRIATRAAIARSF